MHTWHRAFVKVRGQLEGVHSLHPAVPEGQAQGLRLGGTHHVRSLFCVPWWMCDLYNCFIDLIVCFSIF